MIEELLKLDERTIINIGDVAKISKVSPMSIHRAIQRGELPKPVKILGRDSWLVGHILRHINKRLEQAQEKAEEENKRLKCL